MGCVMLLSERVCDDPCGRNLLLDKFFVIEMNHNIYYYIGLSVELSGEMVRGGDTSQGSKAIFYLIMPGLDRREFEREKLPPYFYILLRR